MKSTATDRKKALKGSTIDWTWLREESESLIEQVNRHWQKENRKDSNICEEVMAKNFAKLMANTKPQIQKTWRRGK
jgi:hypothetical protein